MLSLISPAALADSEASVEAREENGFGRIVLSFTRLPPYNHELDAGVLVLSFDDPVSGELGEIPKDLPDYVGLVRRDPDGRAFRFALNRSYRVNLMEAGDQLYLDILPPDWKGAPPALPSHVIKALSRLAAETERQAREEARQREAAKTPYKLSVRLGRNPTFSRIVFDGNKFVAVNMSRQGSQVRVEFEAQADVNLAELKTDTPKYLRDVKLEKSRMGMVLTMTVDDDVDVRGFRQGLAYVVDLSGPDLVANASANKVAETVGAEPQNAEKPVPEDAEDTTVLPAETVSTEAPEADKEKKKVEIVTTALDLAALQPGQVADQEAQPQGPAQQTDEKLQEAVSEKKPKPAPAPAAQLGELQSVAPPPAAAPVKATAEPQPKKETAAPVTPAPAKPAAKAAEKPAKAKKKKPAAIAEGDQVTASVEDIGGNLRVTFPFAQPIAAAAFRRGRTVWLLFDTHEKLNIEAIKDAQGGKLVGVQHVRSGSMQYLRLSLSRGWLTYVANNKSAWVVDIGDMVSGQSEQLRLQRKLRADKRSVIGIKMKKPGRVHWLSDPEVGDRLAVVTAFAPQRSVAKPQDFVEFQALATAHGLAILPHSDDLAVRLKIDEVIITRRNGLTLSAGHADQYMSGRKALARPARTGFIDVNKWRVKDASKLSDRVHAMQRKVAMSADGEKNERRFDLAHLYFANGFAMEAYGILRRMVQIDPALDIDPAFNLLRGAALVLLDRTKEARKDFAVHALAHDQDAALWRGLIETAEKNWETALENFEEGSDAVGSYVDDLQARFRLAAARSALQLKRLARAADELDAMPGKLDSASMRADHQLLRGWYLERVGRSQEALEAYAAIIDGDQRPAAAEAELRTITLQVSNGDLKKKDALKRLERLQLTWRGDDVELETMHLLARYYAEERRYRDAFSTMKNGVWAYPQSRLALLMQDEMKQVFRDLYLRDSIEGLTTFESLALYYDYKELTPVGRQGDEMIRRLADKLIAFDLLDQAAELLDHQINKRLHGAARSQVATRLAMVHLMNHKPGRALRVLRQTRQAGLPAVMRRSRNLLEARSLGELGRAEAAIEILNTMEGEDVERLKADALWSSQQWLKAGTQLEKLLGARWQEAGALEARERFDILRSAISYSLAGDQFALDRVRKKFYPKMIKTPDAESFVLVTKPVTSQGVTFRDLARDIAAIDTLEGFMKEFRGRYDKKGGPEKTSATPQQPGAS